MALINKQDAVNAINAVDNYDDGLAFEVLSHACRDVALLPEVDAEPVRHGKWITDSFPMDDGEYLMERCTACGTAIEYGMGTPYCPFCGAKMDAQEEEE